MQTQFQTAAQSHRPSENIHKCILHNLAVPAQKITQKQQAAIVAFFGVKLRGKHIILAHHTGEFLRIFAAAQHNFGRGRGEIIAVHKVKTRVLRNAFKQRVRLRLVHRVPAHMRHFELVAVRIVLMLALFLVCVAYLVDSTYNPFLYFRF